VRGSYGFVAANSPSTARSCNFQGDAPALARCDHLVWINLRQPWRRSLLLKTVPPVTLSLRIAEPFRIAFLLAAAFSSASRIGELTAIRGKFPMVRKSQAFVKRASVRADSYPAICCACWNTGHDFLEI